MSDHVCEPHPWDTEVGWTNCTHCFQPIRISEEDGQPRKTCPVTSIHGRCERPVGHMDRWHKTRGIEWR